MIDEIEKRLIDDQWIGGKSPSAIDNKKFKALNGQTPSAQSHPNTFAWFCLVSRFTPSCREKWTDGGNEISDSRKE